MNFSPNPLFFKMAQAFQDRVSAASKLIIGNEGSSRSSKTWDAFHLIVAICDANRANPQEIYILRDTLVNCRDFTLKEFQDCLKVIGIYDDSKMVNSPKPIYKLWGHTIKFRGLDDEQSAEGYPSDIIFINEVLETNKGSVNGLIMRCRKLVVLDWNPKFTDHWVFDLEKREDCMFTHSTYKQNRHLQQSVIKEIEGYNPAIPENVKNGTADKYRWKVYGLGERANREGLVFPEVQWIDEFPTKTVKKNGVDVTVDDVEQIGYGCDFGETAQTAIVRIGMRKRKGGIGKDDLFLQKLFYAPTENSDVVLQVMKSLNIPEHIWCDSNQPGWIGDMRRASLNPLSTKKFAGSRAYWIASIKKFNIHIVKDIDFRKEQENFSYRVVDGKQLSETIKKHDHLWSATGYGVVGDFRVQE